MQRTLYIRDLIVTVFLNTRCHMKMIWWNNIHYQYTNWPRRHTKLIVYHTKLILNHTKLIVYHTKLILYHTKLILYHTKLILYHTKLILYHTKLILYHTIFFHGGVTLISHVATWVAGGVASMTVRLCTSFLLISFYSLRRTRFRFRKPRVPLYFSRLVTSQ